MSARVMDGRNRAPADQAASFVDGVEQIEEQIDALKIDFMNQVRVKRAEQKEVLDDAKSQGWPKKIIKDMVKRRALKAKMEAITEDYEADQKQDFVDLGKALGDFLDTDLGKAASAREGQQDERTAGIVDAVKGSMTEEDWDKAKPPVEEEAAE